MLMTVSAENFKVAIVIINSEAPNKMYFCGIPSLQNTNSPAKTSVLPASFCSKSKQQALPQQVQHETDPSSCWVEGHSCVLRPMLL